MQIAKHRLSAAIFDLPMQGSEVSFVTSLRGANRDSSVTPFKSARRNDPAWLSQHHHVKEVGHLNKIEGLGNDGRD